MTRGKYYLRIPSHLGFFLFFIYFFLIPLTAWRLSCANHHFLDSVQLIRALSGAHLESAKAAFPIWRRHPNWNMIAPPPPKVTEIRKGGCSGEGGFGSKTPLSPEKWKRTGTARKKGAKRMIKTGAEKIKGWKPWVQSRPWLFCVCLGWRIGCKEGHK